MADESFASRDRLRFRTVLVDLVLFSQERIIGLQQMAILDSVRDTEKAVSLNGAVLLR
jgi:hypothetical protein